MEYITDSMFRIQNDSIQMMKLELSSAKSKLDSISTIVFKTEIGENYFSDIIALQTTIFLAVLGLLGLLSFAGFFRLISNKLKEQKKFFGDSLTSQKINYDNKIIEFEKRSRMHEFDLRRIAINTYSSLYFIMFEKKAFDISAIYCGKILELFSEILFMNADVIRIDEFKACELWLYRLQVDVSNIELGALGKDDYNDLREILVKVGKIDNEKIKELSETNIEVLNKQYYAKV